jgi:hypothetical protein
MYILSAVFYVFVLFLIARVVAARTPGIAQILSFLDVRLALAYVPDLGVSLAESLADPPPDSYVSRRSQGEIRHED